MEPTKPIEEGTIKDYSRKWHIKQVVNGFILLSEWKVWIGRGWEEKDARYVFREKEDLFTHLSEEMSVYA